MYSDSYICFLEYIMANFHKYKLSEIKEAIAYLFPMMISKTNKEKTYNLNDINRLLLRKYGFSKIFHIKRKKNEKNKKN